MSFVVFKCPSCRRLQKSEDHVSYDCYACHARGKLRNKRNGFDNVFVYARSLNDGDSTRLLLRLKSGESLFSAGGLGRVVRPEPLESESNSVVEHVVAPLDAGKRNGVSTRPGENEEEAS